MPTYEYQCKSCGHELEVMQRMTDARLTTCPQCQQETLEKRISAVNFQLKGTGWYETDFKNKGKPEAKDGKSDAGDGEKKPAEGKDSAKADSGTDKAAKTETKTEVAANATKSSSKTGTAASDD